MVSYPDLIQVGLLIVGIIGLFMQAKKEVTAQPPSKRLLLCKRF